MENEAIMKQLLTEYKHKMDKWGYLVEDINVSENTEENEYIKAVVAQLLENESRELLIAEQTFSSNIAQFKKYAYPLITRVFPTLPINDLVSIQPLKGPVGQIFTFQAKYGSTKAPTAAGTSAWNNPQPKYTSNLIDGEEFRAAGASSTSYSGTLSWTPVVASSVTITIGAVTGTDDGAGNISGSGIASGTINYSTGAVAITLDAAATAAAVAVYKYNSEGNTQQPEVEFEITAQAVQAEDRTLRAKWTPQSMQDMMFQHGVEAERTFTSEMGDMVQREISRDVINQVLASAAAGNVNFQKARPTDISYEQHKQALVDAIVEVSTNIYAATYRGTGNVLVCGKYGMNIIKTLKTFRPDSTANLRKPVGRMGVLNNDHVVIGDIDLDASKILVGYKGDKFVEAGAVYSPYVLLLTDALLNPDDMKIRKAILSRDAFKMIDGNFYGTVTIS